MRGEVETDWKPSLGVGGAGSGVDGEPGVGIVEISTTGDFVDPSVITA
jgi:hypothetical protein